MKPLGNLRMGDPLNCMWVAVAMPCNREVLRRISTNTVMAFGSDDIKREDLYWAIQDIVMSIEISTLEVP